MVLKSVFHKIGLSPTFLSILSLRNFCSLKHLYLPLLSRYCDVWGIVGKLLAEGTAEEPSEEMPGLPCAGHRWFKPDPTRPPQGTADLGTPQGKFI